jgi:hypothetical protein
MMAQLLRIFIEIALWRRGPQDLPASTALLRLVAAIYAGISVVQVGIMGWDVPAALLLVMLDLSLQALWLWGLLVFFAKRPRFLQSFTAFLGVGALLNLLDILMSLLLRSVGIAATSPNNPWPLLQLILLLLILGRILKLTLERTLVMSMALTLVIMVTISVIAQGLVPSG